MMLECMQDSIYFGKTSNRRLTDEDNQGNCPVSVHSIDVPSWRVVFGYLCDQGRHRLENRAVFLGKETLRMVQHPTNEEQK